MTDAAALATLLRDLVDVLIPGEEGWPAASVVGVQGVLAMRLMEVRGQDACDGLEQAVLAAGGPLAPLDEAGRIAVVQRLEQSEPALFKLLRSAVYLGYYENPAVIRAVQGLGQPYKAVPISRATSRRRSTSIATGRATTGATGPAPRMCARSMSVVSSSRRESMPTHEAVDVLIIGSGATGSIAAMVLGQAGLKVVCLEQGGWVEPREHPHYSPDWQWQRRTRWNADVNVRRNVGRLSRSGAEFLAGADVERRRRLDQRLWRPLAALPPVRLQEGPRARPRPRLADRLRGHRALLRAQRPHRRASGLAGDPVHAAPGRLPDPALAAGRRVAAAVHRRSTSSAGTGGRCPPA